jgi:hypothetical protein
MKLIPFLRFGGGRAEGDDVLDAPLPIDSLETPVDEEQQEEEEDEEEEAEEDEEEKPEEKPEVETPLSREDEMLKVFMSVDEEFVDNSGLTSDMEDVSAEELLEEARALSRALGLRVVYEEEQAV